MGPTTLFDKSFLQGLNLDESVWFDNFFICNVCPMFFVETLADLSKDTRGGRTPTDEVRIIAKKFPERSGQPNVHHNSICITELFGNHVTMNGQIQLAGGYLIKTSKGPAVGFPESDEGKAFFRWSRGEFQVVEHEFARRWRASLPPLSYIESSDFISALGIDFASCSSLAEAKRAAEDYLSGTATELDPFHNVFNILHPPTETHEAIIARWKSANCPPLAEYAPYTYYVIVLTIFFHIAIATRLVSERRSNSVDMAYLYYLPFCQLFLSSDNLHRATASLFLRDDQMFVWGPELKADLAKLNEHYSKLSLAEREQGVMSFAPEPPKTGSFLVSQIWDKLSPYWRHERKADKPQKDDGILALLEEIKNKSKAVTANDAIGDRSLEGAHIVYVQKRVRRKKGSWFQVPKDLPDEVD